VLPTDTDALRIVSGMDYCTLLTCTPYGINTHRLLIRGVRTDDETERAGVFVKNEAFRIDPLIVTPITAIPILIIALVIVFIRDRKERKRK
jgi:sortase A